MREREKTEKGFRLVAPDEGVAAEQFRPDWPNSNFQTEGKLIGPFYH